MAERNANIPDDRRDRILASDQRRRMVVVEDGDIFGDGVNIAARVETLATPGSTACQTDALQQVKGKLALDVSDMGEQQLKNIAQPVRVHSVRIGRCWTTSTSAADRWRCLRALDRLYFHLQNLSGDPAYRGHFADGITEDITTALSRISGESFVIARNTAFLTSQGAEPLHQKRSGHELGVRYVLEGSVRLVPGPAFASQCAIDRCRETALTSGLERFDCEPLRL